MRVKTTVGVTMRSTVLTIVALFALAQIAYAQTAGSTPVTSECDATSHVPHDVAAIRRLTLDWAKAYVARDHAWFEANYASEVVINGKPRTREEEINALEPVDSFGIPNATYRVNFYGNVAVATGIETIVVHSGGAETSLRGRFTNVFVYCSGRWLVAIDDWFQLK